MVIGVLTSYEGCPLKHYVFQSNTKDGTTLGEVVRRLKLEGDRPDPGTAALVPQRRHQGPGFFGGFRVVEKTKKIPFDARKLQPRSVYLNNSWAIYCDATSQTSSEHCRRSPTEAVFQHSYACLPAQ